MRQKQTSKKKREKREKPPAHAIIGEFIDVDDSGGEGVWGLDLHWPQHAGRRCQLSDFVAEQRADVEAAKINAPEYGPGRLRLEAADTSLRNFEEIQTETEGWFAEAPGLRPYIEWLLHKHFVALEFRHIARLCRSELILAAATEEGRLRGLRDVLSGNAEANATKEEWEREADVVRASGARVIKSKITALVAERLGVDVRTVERRCKRAAEITASLALP